MGKGEITYNQQIAFCGKSRCRKCREGIGHGPYWYAYKTVNGRTTRTYIGKTLPPHIRPREDKEGDQTLLRVCLLGPFRMQRRTASHHSWQTIPDTVWSAHPLVRSLLAYLISRPARQTPPPIHPAGTLAAHSTRRGQSAARTHHYRCTPGD